MDLEDIILDHLRTDISLDGPMTISRKVVRSWDFEYPRPKVLGLACSIKTILISGRSHNNGDLLIMIRDNLIYLGYWRTGLAPTRPLFECPAVISKKEPLRAEDPKCIDKLDDHIKKFFF